MPTPKVRKKTSANSPPELLAALDAHRQGRLDDAETLYHAALKHDPAHWQALHQLGAIHLARGQLAEALQWIGAAMKSNTGSAEVTSNYGVVLCRLKRDDEAIEYFNRALMLKPGYVPALLTRGASLQRVGRREEALASLSRVIEIDPSHAKAHYNRANVLHELRRFDEALEAYARAAELSPGDANIHWNESLTRLLCGDFKEGWKKYEWRLKRPTHEDRKFTAPLWQGEPVAGKTILVHAEQGFGDTLQFIRYVPLLAKMGAQVALEVQPALKSLVATLEGVSVLISRGETLPDFDLHCPVMSLPLAFKTELATIPADTPYLKVPPDHAQKWRTKLPRKTKPRIAFAWSGSATHEQDLIRSIPLQKFRPLFESHDFQWVSVQRDLRPGDQEILDAHQNIMHVGGELSDFADTAAIVVESDLVLTVDTSVAHLAGALNRPVWTLLQHSPDFRWLFDRADTPWYPAARLFRQPDFGDWDSVIEKVREELGSLIQTP